jgi:GAF domain-containing protein
MQATTFPDTDSQAIVPLLELALMQTNGSGAYLYAFEPGEPFARLAAWAGLAPGSSDWRNLKAPGHILQRPSAVVLHERAADDWRFEQLPEFRKHRFPGVASIPLQDAGEVVGVANFCRSVAAPLPPRELSFLLSLSLPLGALLNTAAIRGRLERANQLLADRKLLARAKGLLQANLGWTEEEAYLHIRRLSRQAGAPMRDIARELIEAHVETRSHAH